MNKNQIKEFKQAQRNYLQSKANDETVKKIDKETKIKVLKTHEFYTEYIPELPEEPIERILDPIGDFRMSEKDFETYCKLVYEENKKSGVYTPDWNTTVDYKTRKELIEAENKLFEIGQYIIPNSVRETLKGAFTDYKYRDYIIDLMIKCDAKTIPIA